MEFDEYQEKAAKYDFFEVTDSLSEVGFIEKVLGLTGEAGEAADKIKKILINLIYVFLPSYSVHKSTNEKKVSI